MLRRLRSIILSNNRVSRVESGLGDKAPELRTLVLTNNRIAALSTIDAIAEFKRLENLVLLRNAVQRQEHYRLYVIHKIPSLKVLDFTRVKRKEREEAAKLFSSATGQAVENAVAKAAAKAAEATGTAGGGGGVEYTDEQLVKIQEAVEAATSPEEVDRIERLVSKGEFFTSGAAGGAGADAAMD